MTDVLARIASKESFAVMVEVVYTRWFSRAGLKGVQVRILPTALKILIGGSPMKKLKSWLKKRFSSIAFEMPVLSAEERQLIPVDCFLC